MLVILDPSLQFDKKAASSQYIVQLDCNDSSYSCRFLRGVGTRDTDSGVLLVNTGYIIMI